MAAVAVIAPATASAAYSSGQTFYVDNSPGCSDSNPGTDPAQPWCTFDNINGQVFAPDDTILLKSGDLWQQTLAPLGSGSPGHPVTVGCYGASCSTVYAEVHGSNSGSDAIDLANQSYWTISNLALTGANNGVHVTYSTLNNAGITLRNLYIYNISGSGVDFDGFNSSPQYTVPTGDSIYSDVMIDNVAVVNAGLDGIVLQAGYAGQQEGACCPNAQQNITVKNSFMENLGGGGFAAANASAIALLSDVDQNNDTTGAAETANYFVAVNGATFTNSIFSGTPWTGATDNSAFNLDNHLSGMTWRGDYIAGNYGSGLEWTENPCFDTCTSTSNTDATVDSNVFINNSLEDSSLYYGDIDATYSPDSTGSITNNLYNDNSQPYNAFAHNVTDYTVSNNVAAASTSDLSDGAVDFSGTQGAGGWSYVSNGTTNAGSFSQMPTYSTSPEPCWTDGAGGVISQLNMVPPSNSMDWVERVWTAPADGTIDIRGSIAMAETGGDGVWAAISNGSTWLWNTQVSGSDSIGQSTDLSNVPVTAGEQIQFAVNDGGWNGGSYSNTDDLVSWTPEIAYV